MNSLDFVSHVSIKDSDMIGVLFPGYTIGQPITVPAGEVKYITVYNGNDYMGPI